jgi:Cu/Ag efflux protein CusF
MKRFATVATVLGFGVFACTAVHAQIKEIPGERMTEKGTVEAVDHTARVLTLKDDKGEFITVDVPESMTRFSQIKVGDHVTATYYDNVVVRLKKPGEPTTNDLKGGVTPKAGTKPGGTIGAQRTMTTVIEAIDPKVPSITFKGPNGWKYSRRVEDKDVLKQVKVGDRVDFTWTEAVQVTIDSPQ